MLGRQSQSGTAARSSSDTFNWTMSESGRLSLASPGDRHHPTHRERLPPLSPKIGIDFLI